MAHAEGFREISSGQHDNSHLRGDRKKKRGIGGFLFSMNSIPISTAVLSAYTRDTGRYGGTGRNTDSSLKGKYTILVIIGVIFSFMIATFIADDMVYSIYDEFLEIILILAITFTLSTIIISFAYAAYRKEISGELFKSEKIIAYALAAGSLIILGLAAFIEEDYMSGGAACFMVQFCGMSIFLPILGITIYSLRNKEARVVNRFLSDFKRNNPGVDSVHLDEVAETLGINSGTTLRLLQMLTKTRRIPGFVFSDGVFYFKRGLGHSSAGNYGDLSDKSRPVSRFDTSSESFPQSEQKNSKPYSHTKNLSKDERDAVTEVLTTIVEVRVPTHVDSGTVAEIFVSLNNKTDMKLENVSLDLSDLEEFFEVEGDMKVASLRPGMELEGAIKIKPLFSKGTFPVNISVTGNGVRITRNETIKVGGTEVY